MRVTFEDVEVTDLSMVKCVVSWIALTTDPAGMPGPVTVIPNASVAAALVMVLRPDVKTAPVTLTFPPTVTLPAPVGAPPAEAPIVTAPLKVVALAADPRVKARLPSTKRGPLNVFNPLIVSVPLL